MMRRVPRFSPGPGRGSPFAPATPCPDNYRVLADGSVRLFDFDGAGWRHAAVEAAYCRAQFCTCWRMARLPEGMVGRMEAAFLGALDPTDPTGFSEAVTPAAVHSTLVQFRWFRRFVLDERLVPPRAPSTGRQTPTYGCSPSPRRTRSSQLWLRSPNGWPPPSSDDGRTQQTCRCTRHFAGSADREL